MEAGGLDARCWQPRRDWIANGARVSCAPFLEPTFFVSVLLATRFGDAQTVRRSCGAVGPRRKLLLLLFRGGCCVAWRLERAYKEWRLAAERPPSHHSQLLLLLPLLLLQQQQPRHSLQHSLLLPSRVCSFLPQNHYPLSHYTTPQPPNTTTPSK